jgi:DNA-binding MarR family transcriptional regulator
MSTPTTNGADAVTDAVLTASRVLVGLSARSIATVDETITLPQFRMLVVLSGQAELKVSVLAEHLGVTSSTATRMIERLLASGLVTRDVNPQSRREVVIALTPAGRQVVTRVTRKRRAEIARVVAAMPERHRSGLVEALEAFNAAAGEPSATVRGADWI